MKVKDYIKKMESLYGTKTKSSYDKQIGGTHYKKMKIQPMIIERDYAEEKEKKESWAEGYRKWKKERCPHN